MSSGAIVPTRTNFHPRVTHTDTRLAWGLTALGVAAGVITLEFILSFFVAGWHTPKTPIRETRQYTEGIAVAHFLPDGFGTYGDRLTGNPVLPNAASVLLIGDSHLVQEAVSDRQTMGSVVERLSRSQGKPVNVRQYGWYDAAAPVYIANAPELLRVLHPRIAVVLLNPTDFTREALDEGWYWLMNIHPDYSIDLVDIRLPEPHGRLEQIRELAGRSHLLLALRRRSVLLFPNEAMAPVHPPGPYARQAEVPMIARASIKGLKAAYGSQLMVGYLPFCGATCTAEPDAYEAKMLAACEAEQVHCFSTRPAMSADLQKNHRILRGFHNTPPGADHLNADGLEVAGTVIWQEVSKRLQ
jgi:hypothetical protein